MHKENSSAAVSQTAYIVRTPQWSAAVVGQTAWHLQKENLKFAGAGFGSSFIFAWRLWLSGYKDGAYLRFVPNTGYRYVTSEETLSAIAYKNSNLLIPDGKSMGTYRFCNENVRFTILDKNKYYNAESAQYILSIGFRPEDTTSEQMLNCIRNLIDIGIIAKDDASS